MNYNWKNIFKIFNKVILILGIINLCLNIQNNYVRAEENNKIKVGYPSVSGFTEINDGVYSGFSYEYLREIAKYTGWEYEFIQMTDEDMLKKLRNGEIDIACGIIKNEQTMELYNFPEYNTGATYTTLVTLKDNNNINSSNYETLDGIKVGYFKTMKVELEKFNDFCKYNGIENIELIPYSDETGNELKEALKTDEVDAIINGDLLKHEEEKIVAKFGEIPYYFVTTKGNTEIIAGLNKAIYKIKESDPDYNQELYNKYFKTLNEHAISLTKEEQEYIKTIGSLKAIYVDNNIPVQYYNSSTNEEDGIFIELVNLIMKRAGFKIQLIKVDTYEKAYNMMKNKEADLIVAVPSVYSIADENNFFLTQSYLNVDMMVKVINKNIVKDKEIMALPKGYGYAELNDNIEVKYYENIEECLMAVEKGQATLTYGNNYSIANYIATSYYSNLSIVYEGTNIGASIGIAKPINKNLINIINKAIDTLSSDDINNIIYENTVNIHYKATLRQLFFENIALFTMIIISILGIIATLIFIIIRDRFKKIEKAKELLLKKSQTDALTGVYNRITCEELIIEYLNIKPPEIYVAFAIIDIDYFKQVNDKLGHQIGDELLKKFAIVLKEIFDFKDIICRLGGDEFVLFMKDVEEVDINIINERLEQLCKVMNKEITYNNVKQKISLSIGAIITNEDTDFNKLYKQADEILYEVKRNGRNGFKISLKSL